MADGHEAEFAAATGAGALPMTLTLGTTWRFPRTLLFAPQRPGLVLKSVLARTLHRG